VRLRGYVKIVFGELLLEDRSNSEKPNQTYWNVVELLLAVQKPNQIDTIYVKKHVT